ncbi:hypothetical protein GCM10027615_00310 [Plantactinospora veratri]
MTRSSARLIKPLSQGQTDEYRREGFLMLSPDHLSDTLLADVQAAVPEILGQDGPHRILERDGITIRSVYGPHRSSAAVAALARWPGIIGAAAQILDDDVYVHQSKLNVKAAFAGDRWEWHQDYINWLERDGIQSDNLINVALFLDDVSEFNGPLTFIPGSHSNGLLDGSDIDGMPAGYEEAAGWVSTLTATERFQIDREIIARLARERGWSPRRGRPGQCCCSTRMSCTPPCRISPRSAGRSSCSSTTR